MRASRACASVSGRTGAAQREALRRDVPSRPTAPPPPSAPAPAASSSCCSERSRRSPSWRRRRRRLHRQRRGLGAGHRRAQARRPGRHVRRLRRRRQDAARLHPGRHAAHAGARLVDAAVGARRDGRDRGRALLQAQRRRLRGHRPRGDQERLERRDRAGRLDAHDAARPQPLHRQPRRAASPATSARSARRSSPRSSRTAPAAAASAGSSTSTSTTSPTAPSAARPRSASRPPRGSSSTSRRAPDAAGGRAARRPAAGAVALQPVPRPGRRAERRNEVLRARCADAGYITAEQEAAARAAPLGVKRSAYYAKRRESYFFDYVRTELIKEYGADRVREGGLKVYTTIDLKMQQAARNAIAGRLPNPGDPSSAIVDHRPEDRAHQGDGLLGRLRRVEVQPRRPGPPPARLDVQGHGADDRAAPGRRHPQDDLRLQAAELHRPDYGEDRGQHRRPTATAAASRSSTALVAPTTPSTSSSTSTSAPSRSARPPTTWASRPSSTAIPAEGLGGLRIGVSPLEMTRAYATINNGGWRVRPIAITKVVFPDGRERHLARQDAARQDLHRRPDLRGDADPGGQRPARHRHGRPARLPGGRQDRHDERLHRRVVRRLHDAR